MVVFVDRVVLDTNVVFEGVTRRGSACGLLIDAWSADLFTSCVSNALAYEYVDVLSRKLSEKRWAVVRPLVRALLDRAEFVEIHYSWRPTSPDPADEAIVDCTMNAGAILVTRNVRDFRAARAELGLPVLTPEEFLERIAAMPEEEETP